MAITQATALADFSTGIGTAGAVLQVDNADGRVGIGTTDPQADLQVGIAITMDGNAGVITASSFSGSGANLTFTGADISAATGTFTGNVSVGGTLTYEDVTNVDSVGIITARSGVRVTGGNIQAGDSSTGFSGTVISGFSTTTAGNAGTIQAKNFGSGGANFVGFDAAGNDTARILADGGALFASDVSIADKIIHTGDTNTAIRFPAADTFTIETGGSEALRVDSSQRLLIGETSAVLDTSNALLQMGASEGANMVLYRDDSSVAQNDSIGLIRFYSNAGSSKQEHARISATAAFTSGADDKPGNLIFYTTADGASSVTERLRIDSLGNIGVNQTSVNSSRKMEITQPASYTSGLRINSAGSAGNGAFVEFFVGSANYKVGGSHSTNALLFQKDGTEYMRHDSSGRLLINTTSSKAAGGVTADLQIEGTSTGSLRITRNASDAAPPHLVFSKSGGTSIGSNTTVDSGDNLGRIRFAGADGTDHESIGAEISAAVDTTPGSNDMPGRLEFSTTADGASSPTLRMTIDSSGQVFMGSSSSTFNVIANKYSAAALHLSGGGGGSANIDLHGSTHSSDAKVITFDTNSAERMRILSDGRLLVGTTSALSDGLICFKGTFSSNRGLVLESSESSGEMIRFNTSSGNAGKIDSNGTSTTYGTSSDYRLKENIVDLDGAIDRVKQLAPKRFNFIADAETTVDGFLAHEAQTVVPEAITGTHNGVEVWKEGAELPDGVSVGDNKLDEDGNTIPDYQCIDQSKLVPLLTAALKEAIAEIETLKTKVAALEGS